MGGKQSKDTKKSTLAAQITAPSPVSTSGKSPVNAVPTSDKSPKTATLSQAEQSAQTIGTMVSMVLECETVRNLVADVEFTPQAGYFCKLFHEALNGPAASRDSCRAKIVQFLTDEIKKHPNLDAPSLFFLCLVTGMKKMRIPKPRNDAPTLQSAIQKILDEGLESVEGTELEPVTHSLLLDVCYIQGNNMSSKATIEELFAKAKSNPLPANIQAGQLLNTIHSMQQWIFDKNEELEEDERVSGLVNAFRAHIPKALENREYNEEVVYPHYLPMPLSIRMMTFHLGLNLNFGRLCFHKGIFLGRSSRVLYQCYIDDRVVKSKEVDALSDLTIGSRHGEYDEIAEYLPTFDDAIKKIGETIDDVDLANDYDAIVVGVNANHYSYFRKGDIIFKGNDNSCLTEFHAFFSREPGFLDEGKIRIIIQSDTVGDGMSGFAYLITANQGDKLNVLFEKLSRIITEGTSTSNNFSASFISHILNNLVISTKARLSKTEFLQAKKTTGTLDLSVSTPLSKIVEAFTNKDPHYKTTEAKHAVDLVFYLNTDIEDYSHMLLPANIESNAENFKPPSLKLELSSLLNMQLTLAGHTRESCASFTEAQLREFLPSVIFANIEEVRSLINLPREVRIDCVTKAIEDLGLTLSPEYKATAYLCTKKSGGAYRVTLNNNTAHAVIDGKEVTCNVNKLNLKAIEAVLFERKLPKV
jgi:hypothetical protein